MEDENKVEEEEHDIDWWTQTIDFWGNLPHDEDLSEE